MPLRNHLPIVSQFFCLFFPIRNVVSFSGDLGGYLGLLIGGSVLTLIEVVDLVFYNALLKLMGKR